jgi:hypothetical protein
VGVGVASVRIPSFHGIRDVLCFRCLTRHSFLSTLGGVRKLHGGQSRSRHDLSNGIFAQSIGGGGGNGGFSISAAGGCCASTGEPMTPETAAPAANVRKDDDGSLPHGPHDRSFCPPWHLGRYITTVRLEGPMPASDLLETALMSIVWSLTGDSGHGVESLLR